MDGRTEIPDLLYRSIYEDEVKFGIDRGLWVDDARRRAAEIMCHTYVARSTAIQCDEDWDAEHRDLAEDWWSRR